ncbi:hypothetical protein OIU79_022113 [Salix purpurea]|uniref:Uncharacterized protein n=1 Tax=Salix purpurea TaxID=77065 RepID=A0A9Q0WF27_SALPP|nr:hypothetical protein OIU79_022113 [Salix purpurea]
MDVSIGYGAVLHGLIIWLDCCFFDRWLPYLVLLLKNWNEV